MLRSWSSSGSSQVGIARRIRCRCGSEIHWPAIPARRPGRDGPACPAAVRVAIRRTVWMVESICAVKRLGLFQQRLRVRPAACWQPGKIQLATGQRLAQFIVNFARDARAFLFAHGLQDKRTARAVVHGIRAVAPRARGAASRSSASRSARCTAGISRARPSFRAHNRSRRS